MVKFFREWPIRYTVATMAGIGNLIATATRVSLNIAIVAMVNQTSLANHNNKSSTAECADPFPDQEETIDAYKGGEFMWTSYTQGIVIASFFYGSLCTQIAGGVLSEKFGAKWIVGLGIFISGLIACLIPVAAPYGAIYVIFVRVVQGLCQGLIHPGMYSLIVLWAPKPERGTLSSIMLFGGVLGSGVGSALAGLFSSMDFLGGWPVTFYLNSIISTIWMLLWVYLVYSTPEENPRITLEELFHIKNLQRSESLANTRIKLGIPWAAMLTSLPFWSVLLIRFAHYWDLYTGQTGLPLYMSSAINIPVEKNGGVTGAAFILSSAGVVFGGLADYIKRNTNLSLTCIRKLFSSAAYLGASLCFGLIPSVGCDRLSLSALFIVAQLFLSISIGSDSIIVMDMAPRYVGTLHGIVSTLADGAGFLNPMYTGFITESDVSIQQWSYVFYTAVAITLFCWVIFVLFASAEIQPWAQVEVEDTEDIIATYIRKQSYGSITTSQTIDPNVTFY